MAYTSMQELDKAFLARAKALHDQFPYDEEVLRKDQLILAPWKALMDERNAEIEKLMPGLRAAQQAKHAERRAAFEASRTAEAA